MRKSRRRNAATPEASPKFSPRIRRLRIACKRRRRKSLRFFRRATNTSSRTSEFDLVKARLRRIENKNKLDDKKSAGDKPTLRTRTEQQPPASTTGTQQPQAGSGSGDDSDPDRPVLKKRTDDGTNPN